MRQSQMERDCRRRIELDLELADVEATLEWLKGRRVAILADRIELGRRIIKAISGSGKPDVAVPVEAAGRSWTVSYSPWGGISIAEVVSADSPLFRQPPVADAVADSPSGDDGPEVKAAVDARVGPWREAVIRNGKTLVGVRGVVEDDQPAGDIDAVKGLGGFLADRYGRPDEITQAAFDMAVEDELGPGGRDLLRSLLDDDGEFPVRCDDPTVIPDDDAHAVVEHQAAS